MDPLIMAQMGAQVAEPTMQNTAWQSHLWTPFHDFVTALLTKLDAAQGALIAAQLEYLNPALRVIMTIIVILGGLTVAYGTSDMRPIVRMFTRFVVACFLISNVPTYVQWVAGPLGNLPNEFGTVLAGALGGTQFVGDGSPFDTALSHSWQATILSWQAAPWMSLKAVFLAIMLAICFLISAVCIAVAFMIWCVALLSLKILLYVGPVFIAFYVWPPTAQWGANWVAACMAAAFTQVLAVLIIVVSGLSQQATTDPILAAYAANTGGENVMTMVQASVVQAISAGLLTVFLSQIPRMSGALFSGFAASASQFAGTAGSYAANTYAAGRAVGNWASGGSSGPMRGR